VSCFLPDCDRRARLVMRERRFDERLEQRMAVTRRGREFRVELHADEPRVHAARQFHHFRQIFTRGTGADDKAAGFELGHEAVIDFITVTVTLVHVLAIDLFSHRARLDWATLRTETHRAAEVRLFGALFDAAVTVVPRRYPRDHAVRCARIDLGAVRVLQADHVASEFDHRELHAETDAKVRHLRFTRITDGRDLAFGTAPAEAARHQHGVEMLEALDALRFDLFRVDVFDVDLGRRMNRRMAQRFDQRLVRLRQVDILANHADGDLVLRMFE